MYRCRDKFGGTLTTIGSLAAGFNKNVWRGINYTFFLGQFKGLEGMAQYQENLQNWFDDKNKMYEDRYKDNEKLLMDSAMQAEGFKRVTKDMMDTLAAPPEEYNYVKITTDLGQVLYYYKEINKEKNKGSSIPSLATDQQKAVDDWEKKKISMQAEINKMAIGKTKFYDRTPDETAEIEFQKKLIDNLTKYNLAMKEADALEKEKKITLDKSLIAQQFTAANEEAALVRYKASIDYRNKLDEEQLKETLKRSQERATILLDNETYVSTRLKQDWENRITEEERTAGLQHANLTKLLILGKISWGDYWKDIEALQMASGKRQLDIINEKNRNILEAETSHHISILNMAEKEMTMPQAQVISGRIEAYKTQVAGYTADLQKASEAGDKLLALNIQAKIDAANASLAGENLLLREQTGTFNEGLIWGIKEYGYTMKTEFQYGRDLVKDTASAMKDSFKDAFGDIRKGTFDLGDSFVNLCDRIAANFDDTLADILTNWIMTGNTMKQSGMGGSSGGGSSGGFGGILTSIIGWISSAKGNVFSTPDLAPYRNSIVMKPTLFKFAHGIGLMGEGGGPGEAIMPLTRTPSGDLGVRSTGAMNVKIELKNESGIQLEQDEQPEIKFDFENMVVTTIIRRARSDRKFRETLRGGKTY